MISPTCGRSIAKEYGFEIRWDRMTEAEMVAASIASFEGDNEPLKMLICKHLSNAG